VLRPGFQIQSAHGINCRRTSLQVTIVFPRPKTAPRTGTNGVLMNDNMSGRDRESRTQAKRRARGLSAAGDQDRRAGTVKEKKGHENR
jgi:hypothetical protein